MMKTKKYIVYICLFFIAIPFEGVMAQGLAKFDSLKGGSNSFSKFCKYYGRERDDIGKVLKYFEIKNDPNLASIDDSTIVRYYDSIFIYSHSIDKTALDDIAGEYKQAWRNCNIKKANDSECISFLRAWDRFLYKIEEIIKSSKSINNSNKQIDGDDEKGDEYEDGDDEDSKNYSDTTYGLDGFDNDLYIFLLFCILCIIFLFLLVKYIKLKRQLRDKDSHTTLTAKVTNNSNKTEGETNNTRNRSVVDERKLVEKANNIPNVIASIPTNNVSSGVVLSPLPNPSVPVVPASVETILYVTVDASENGKLFKATHDRSDQHLYEIHLKDPNDCNGELRLCSNIKPVFAKKFIDERQSFFKICDVSSTGIISPTRFEMKKPGQVVKSANEWRVTVPPVVEFR